MRGLLPSHAARQRLSRCRFRRRPAEDFGKFGQHIVIDTKLTGGSSEIGGSVSGRMERGENFKQIALAGGHRSELIVADTASLCN